MAEYSRFFDSTPEDERIYTADEFAEYFRMFLTNGIFNGGTNLKVKCTGSDLGVFIVEGYAWIEGYLYKIADEDLYLPLELPDSNLDRIDRIILRLDKTLEKRHIKAIALKGKPGTEPIAPKLTRDENTYEISLAQVKILAGKSYIESYQITDERFDKNLCGIVTHLFEEIDTTEIFEGFEAEFDNWFQEVQSGTGLVTKTQFQGHLDNKNNPHSVTKSQVGLGNVDNVKQASKAEFDALETEIVKTYLPRADLREGFITAPEEQLYFIPDGMLQIGKKGWPLNTHDIKPGLNRLAVDVDGNLYIDELKQLYEQLVRYNVLADKESHQLNSINWLAIPFTPDHEAKHLKITIDLKRNSIARIRALICEAKSSGLPDLSKEMGRYFSDNYNELGTSFSRTTIEMMLDKVLKPGKQYCFILYSHSPSYYIQTQYSDTQGIFRYMVSTDGGSTWINQERTPALEIEGVAPVDEGNIIIPYNKILNFKKHVRINFELLESENSSYKVDILDLGGNVIVEDIKPGDFLLDYNLNKNTKLRISLLRAKGENPRLANYEHMWVADMASSKIDQCIIPSDDLIMASSNTVSVSGPHISTEYVATVVDFHTHYPGNYRIKGELRTDSSARTAGLRVLDGDNNIIGVAAVTGTTSYTPVSIDLKRVMANERIRVRVYVTTYQYTAYARNISIHGTKGYQLLEYEEH
jgi:hypothetical protein